MTLAKAELHMHLEAGATPDFIAQQARKYNETLPMEVFGHDGSFNWQGLEHFVNLYDVFANVIRSEEDYRLLTETYLTDIAQQGAVYAEIIVSPDHGAKHGLSYLALMDAVAQGIDDAKAATGIESRIQITCVRNYGVEACENVAKQAVKNRHPYVTGFGIAGAEMVHEHKDFAKTFKIAHEEAGLFCTAHAGEACGAESVRQALTHFPVTRIGHGVRSIEDPKVIEMLLEKNITLEVCPSSNVLLGVAPNWQQHPLKKLVDLGVKTCLNTDDPLYFNTSLEEEYARSKKYLGFTDGDLLKQTQNALEAAFCDDRLKAKLLSDFKKNTAAITVSAPKPRL